MLKNIMKTDDIAKWIIIVIALVTLIFNTGVLYNEVKHLKENDKIIMRDISEIKTMMIERK